MATSPLSSAIRSAESKNTMMKGTLKKELNKLDHERLQRMQELRAESQKFRQHLINRSGSPSSRPNSAYSRRGSDTRTASQSPSPTRGRDTSPASPAAQRTSRSATARKMSARSQVLTASPEARRKSSIGVKQNENSLMTNQLHRVEVKPNYDQPVTGVPQIIISEIGAEQPPPDRHRPGPAPARRGSLCRGGSLDSPRGADAGSDFGLSQSLVIPVRRQRSNSMPLVLPDIHTPPSRRPSYCPDPDLHTSDSLSVADTPRARSVSFSGIEPARRRGSICERWGSESERAKPRARGAERRGSIGMEQMVRDLLYGVQHRELMTYNRESGVTDKQWEDLKKCRYLRFPSNDNSEEENED